MINSVARTSGRAAGGSFASAAERVYMESGTQTRAQTLNTRKLIFLYKWKVTVRQYYYAVERRSPDITRSLG